MARKTIARKSAAGTRKATLNKRRKGILSVIVPWMRRFGIVLGIVVLAIWVGSWLWLNGSIYRSGVWAQNQIIQAGADMGFRVENVLVEGRVYSDPEIIMAIVNTQKNDPLFAFDPRQAQELIEQLSWVDTVHVQRRLPDTIYIGLTERQPLALWQDGKSVKLLDDKGEVINAGNLGRFKNLIKVTGKGAPEEVSHLVSNINAEEVLHGRVRAAKWISQRRWDVVLTNNITVKLPEEDIGLSLRRLAQAQEEGALLDKDILAIDLREWDRITIRTEPGKVQEYKASLKDVKTGAQSGNNI